VGIGCALFAAAFFGYVCVMGWSFYVSAGQGHGPGLEMAVLGGLLTLASLGVALWLKRRAVLREQDEPPTTTDAGAR
jgi:hypothetical protein